MILTRLFLGHFCFDQVLLIHGPRMFQGLFNLRDKHGMAVHKFGTVRSVPGFGQNHRYLVGGVVARNVAIGSLCIQEEQQ